MIRKAVMSIFLLPLLQAAAQLPDANEVMTKSREASLTGSMSATVSLLISEKNGSSRSRSIAMSTKSYENGLEKRFIRFLEPADVRGTTMLIYDNKSIQDEMWIYLPALKKTRRIVSSEKGKSFMSSEFSNADMSSPTLSDFMNKHLPGSGTDRKWIIESTPVSEDKADEYGYSRKISYINSENWQILKMEFFNFDNELFKVIEIRKVFPLSQGRFLVSDMLARNLLNDRKSEMIMSNIKEGIEVDDAVFSVQNLER